MYVYLCTKISQEKNWLRFLIELRIYNPNISGNELFVFRLTSISYRNMRPKRFVSRKIKRAYFTYALYYTVSIRVNKLSRNIAYFQKKKVFEIFAVRRGLLERPLCQRDSVVVKGMFYDALNITLCRW